MAGAQGSGGSGGSGGQEGAGARRAGRSRRSVPVVGAAAAGLVVGGGGVGTVWVLTEQHAWNWPTLADFTTSPGFGGLAALGAGALAFAATRLAARASRETADDDRRQREGAADRDREQKDLTDRRGQWWKRAQWALDLTLDERPGVAAAGFKMLTALSKSEWAGVHEDEWVRQMADHVLNNLGGQPVGPYDDGDDDSGAEESADGGRSGDEDSTRGLLRRTLGWLRGEP